MTEITEKYQAVRRTLPSGVTLVAVSKFHPAEAVRELYDAGQRIFGESRVQELCAKRAALPADIEWHFIGHLQTNKVKNIVPFVALVHGVDSPRLLAEIDRESGKIGRTTDCLLQVHVAQEETKFGFSESELSDFLKAGEWRNLRFVRIRGLMGMASNVTDEAKISGEFRRLRTLFDGIKNEFFKDDDAFSELSMGMSHDYPLALAEGSTMVRVGTSIFGERIY